MSAIQLLDTPLFNLSSCVAYYRFLNGALTTDSKSTNTLTNHGTTTFSAGKFGNGISITSNTQWMDAATNLGITGGNITIMGWFQMNTAPTTQQYNIGFQSDATSHVAYWIDYEFNGGGGNQRINFARFKSGTATQYSFYTVTLDTVTPNHFAMTYDGTNVTGYFNGNPVVQTAYSGNGASGLANLTTVGQDNVNGDANSNHGIYSDVAFFNAALNSTQISLAAKGNSYSLRNSLRPRIFAPGIAR